MLSFIENFIYRYFVVEGYDIVDTLTYGIVLGLCTFAIIPLLKRIGLRIDNRLIVTIIPFIIYGSTTRELVDRKLGAYGNLGPFPQNYFFVSPGIFLTMFCVTIAALYLGMRINREKYHWISGTLGWLIAAYNITLIIPHIKNLGSLTLVLIAFTASSSILMLLTLKLKFLWNEKNYVIAMAHLLDASATYVGIDFSGYIEQHVLPNVLIKNFGTALVMFPLKFAVVLPALYVIDKSESDETARRFIKIVVLVLGLGPALRDITLLVLGN